MINHSQPPTPSHPRNVKIEAEIGSQVDVLNPYRQILQQIFIWEGGVFGGYFKVHSLKLRVPSWIVRIPKRTWIGIILQPSIFRGELLVFREGKNNQKSSGHFGKKKCRQFVYFARINKIKNDVCKIWNFLLWILRKGVWRDALGIHLSSFLAL